MAQPYRLGSTGAEALLSTRRVHLNRYETAGFVFFGRLKLRDRNG
jgi:hypothetical protein